MEVKNNGNSKNKLSIKNLGLYLRLLFFEIKEKQILKMVGLSVMLIGIASGAVLTSRVQMFARKAATTNVALSLPTSVNAGIGETITLPVMLDTDGYTVSAVDVVITFDRTVLQVESVKSRSDTSTLKSYLPQTNGVYDNQAVTDKANQNGKIEFGAVAFISGIPTGGFNGSLGTVNPFAQITFKTLKAANTPVNFVFNGISVTTDSNVSSGTTMTDILGRVQNATISVSAPSTPTPTASLTPTAKPTSTSTPTPTKSAIDTTDPTVSFSNPSDGTKVKVNTDVRFYVNATDNAGVDKVQFYINGTWVHVEEDSPYTYTWRVPGTAGKNYTIMARALDYSGNAASSSITLTSTN